MARLLVFQHVAHEILGTLDPLLRKSGFRIKYVNFGRDNYRIPEIRNYDGLIVLGGPMNVDEVDNFPYLEREIKAIEKALKCEIPILGICLGSQLLAKALGSRVGKNNGKEIGWYDVTPTGEGTKDNLISKFSGTEKIFQWHGDTFEVPDGGVLLASSGMCKNQAFRYGDKVYGFQFHLEVDRKMIERWLTIPDNVKELDELKGVIDPEMIRSETPLYIGRLHDLSDATFSEFINLFDNLEKHHVLPSR